MQADGGCARLVGKPQPANVQDLGEMLDLSRMRRARLDRLTAAMRAAGMDALLLLGPSNQAYAGLTRPCADAMRMHYETVAMLVPASGAAHLWIGTREGIPPEIPASHVHPPLALDYEEGVAELAAALRDVAPGCRRLGIDETTGPLLAGLPALLAGVEIVDGTQATIPARLQKTPDEIECMRIAQRINEDAMGAVEAALRPGVRQNELSAAFFRRAFELGSSVSIIDPIWSLTPVSTALQTVTANGDVGFPLSSNDRFLREGDLVLSDTGLGWNGYHSDFGKTWICSLRPKPSAALRDCYLRWRDLIEEVYAAIRPGASCGDLVRAAQKVEPKHALKHFYLGHGLGCDSAEGPIIGSDLGLPFDDTVELKQAMVFVLEPVVWRDGVGGYRSEEVVAVTDTGYDRLSQYGYAPFE